MIILHQGRCGKFVWLHSASSMSGTLGCEWIAVWWHIHRSWLLKLGSGCYGVDRRCGGAEVKGVAGLVESGVETEIRS